MPLHIRTPLIKSEPLSQISNKNVWLKKESLQPTGSFKNRGICFACETYSKQGAQEFISSSGGNAGIAVAFAGRILGIPVTVVVPKTTTNRAIQFLNNENAKVIIHGDSWLEANEKIQTLITENSAFIHPFDDPYVWQGHATMIDEVYDSGFKPDAIVLSVGGGGMLSGVCQGLQKYNWNDIPVLAVETQGAASYHHAVNAGKPIMLEKIDSIATSLGAKQVCQQAFATYKEFLIRSTLVCDQDALHACQNFLNDHRVLVEPACGASLSITCEHAEKLEEFESVLIIVCGGVTTTINQIQGYIRN